MLKRISFWAVWEGCWLKSISATSSGWLSWLTWAGRCGLGRLAPPCIFYSSSLYFRALSFFMQPQATMSSRAQSLCSMKYIYQLYRASFGNMSTNMDNDRNSHGRQYGFQLKISSSLIDKTFADEKFCHKKRQAGVVGLLLVLEARLLVINVNMQRLVALSDGGCAPHNQPSLGFVCCASVISHAGHQTAKKRVET